MFAGKPIIGIVGGIGSGKSFVARLFGDEGGLVIDSDVQVRQAYTRPDVRARLREWWGDIAFDEQGEIDRAAIARRVFSDPAEKRKLEGVLHPLVAEMRQRQMEDSAGDPRVKAFIWDTPLLVETGLHRECDAVVFVDAPEEQRKERVMARSGWTPRQWAAREKSQLPLDKKREVAKYIIENTAGADDVRSQVRRVLSRILAGTTPDRPQEVRPPPEVPSPEQ